MFIVKSGPLGFEVKEQIILGLPGASVVKNPPANEETQIWSLGWGDPVEKEMATHSSIFAWEIPWTEEPGGLQYMGSKKESDMTYDQTTTAACYTGLTKQLIWGFHKMWQENLNELSGQPNTVEHMY